MRCHFPFRMTQMNVAHHIQCQWACMETGSIYPVGGVKTDRVFVGQQKTCRIISQTALLLSICFRKILALVSPEALGSSCLWQSRGHHSVHWETTFSITPQQVKRFSLSVLADTDNVHTTWTEKTLGIEFVVFLNTHTPPHTFYMHVYLCTAEGWQGYASEW